MTLELYLINVKHTFSFDKTKKTYYQSKWYTKEELINSFGFSETSSVVWKAENGIIKSWFNIVMNKYWDNKEKKWVANI